MYYEKYLVVILFGGLGVELKELMLRSFASAWPRSVLKRDRASLTQVGADLVCRSCQGCGAPETRLSGVKCPRCGQRFASEGKDWFSQRSLNSSESASAKGSSSSGDKP